MPQTVPDVRNQKVASKFIKLHFFAEDGVRPFFNGIASQALSPRLTAGAQGAQAKAYPERLGAARPVVWTAVRDPIATAVDAYLEVSRRPFDVRQHYDGPPLPEPAWRAMPCDTRKQAEQRLHAFLDDPQPGFIKRPHTVQTVASNHRLLAGHA